MGSSRRERKVVAACHALSHLICSAAPVSVPDCEAVVCCEPKVSPKPEEPRMGVAVGVGVSTSLGGGKTEAKIRSWNPVIVVGSEDLHGSSDTAEFLRKVMFIARLELNHRVTCRLVCSSLEGLAVAA